MLAPSPSRSTSPPLRAMPPADTMYRALVERDTALDGAFFAGIRTTGIFCRPGCGAKKPRRENVEFFPTIAEALGAGYRPCKRCRPLDGGDRAPDDVQRALALIEQRPDARLTAADLRAHDLEPSRLSRYFKSHYGVTFQAFHRARRLGRALTPLRQAAANPAARAAANAGFGSESGFREAFERLFGATWASRGSDAAAGTRVVLIRQIETPLGPMLGGATDEGACFLEWIDRRAIETQVATLRRTLQRLAHPPTPAVAIVPDPAGGAAPVAPRARTHLDTLASQLARYFAGTLSVFTVPLHAPGTPFQEQVWRELQRIPHGATRSYLDIARAIGRPTATRAVARANGDNRLAILIPCHRVIGSDGSLTGYGGHPWRKQWLLDHESAGGLFGTKGPM